MKVSDYICQFLLDHGIDTIFCVRGDAISPLLNSIKRRPELTIYFNYGEMGCAMAAESFQRVGGKIPLVLTNMGPGATNAITGVVGAWQESVPYLVISGQCSTSQAGCVPELPMAPIVETFTKYAASVRCGTVPRRIPPRGPFRAQSAASERACAAGCDSAVRAVVLQRPASCGAYLGYGGVPNA